jgi:hypothetical protein
LNRKEQIMVNGNPMLPSASSCLSRPLCRPRLARPTPQRPGRPRPPSPSCSTVLAAQASAATAAEGEAAEPVAAEEAAAATLPEQAASLARAAEASGKILPVGLPEAAISELAAKTLAGNAGDEDADKQDPAADLASALPTASGVPEAAKADQPNLWLQDALAAMIAVLSPCCGDRREPAG